MSMGASSQARFQAIRELTTRTPRAFEVATDKTGRPLKVSEYFGMNTFNLDKMKTKLPKDVFEKLASTIEMSKPLDAEIAAAVAHAVHDWAISQGVTHFCHWFQPQTGSTAEKHDAFLTFDDDMKPIEKFSGSQLIQSEPDASSFPSGGMRTTFEARGYTAWDPSSPMFIVEGTNGKTLCIPSVFISYHGDALDEKTGLMRSIEVLSQKATELLHVIGNKNAKRVIPTLGCEQEYFLIDRAFYNLRPDLVMAGRTLVGGKPPRGQQLEDHYFGSIPSRVLAYMAEMEFELFKLGVPVKTRHNEVAPSQFETAPIFEEANVATDHNQLVMEVLRRVAKRHAFECLMHEKPFAGLNGSGKHCNWSLSITASGSDLNGTNLLNPGKTPQANLRFLTFLCATIKGVHKHGGLLRSGIASSGNDHRLGANEAPPAIISVFLGDMLSKILDEIEKGTEFESDTEEKVVRLGVGRLPNVMKDNTDRNRTSPFAFTGNKFEFRAVGASMSPAFPVTLLNAAVADGIAEITQSIQAKLKSAKSLEAAILDVLKQTIKETKAVRFEGNNYSEEWQKEAERRGLPNLRKTPESLEQMITPASKKMLESMGIFTEAEIISRYKVRNERYLKNLLIEIDSLRAMIDTQVLPATYAYHGVLLNAVAAAKTAGMNAPQTDGMNKLSTMISSLQTKRATLDKLMDKVESMKDEEAEAKFISTDVTPVMEDIRLVCNELETMVADDFWPLPKYREMLFLS
ncbi:MAG: glutamine synthetase III [Bacteriovoracia bacterium]